jgi:hypothetical protein
MTAGWTTEVPADISTNDSWTKEDFRNVVFSFCLLSVPVVMLALLSNGLAFLVSML